jgi:hypothetical protein
MTCSTSKISRLDTGKGVPKVPDVREPMRIDAVTSDTEQDMLLRPVHHGREHGWWSRSRRGSGLSDSWTRWPRYAAMETEAVQVRAFEMATQHRVRRRVDVHLSRAAARRNVPWIVRCVPV